MQFFDSKGVRIAFIDIAPEGGAGDPILLIHGFASNHAVNWVNTLWTTTLSRAGFRVIALDNRGHGQSQKLYRPEDYDSWTMAEDARNLLDHLDIERADVMGYSRGARISAHLALLDPARVRSILAQSGWRDIELRPVDVECRLTEAELGLYARRMGPVADLLPSLDEPTRSEVERRLDSAFVPFVSNGEARFTAACWLVTARA